MEWSPDHFIVSTAGLPVSREGSGDLTVSEGETVGRPFHNNALNPTFLLSVVKPA